MLPLLLPAVEITTPIANIVARVTAPTEPENKNDYVIETSVYIETQIMINLDQVGLISIDRKV